jgi:hypothetical protein
VEDVCPKPNEDPAGVAPNGEALVLVGLGPPKPNVEGAVEAEAGAG